MRQEIDESFMKQALKEASKAFEKGEVPVGAVLVHEGKVIARSHNQVESLQDATAHAEMVALTMGASYLGNWRLLKTTLYCTLEPCMMCLGAMLLARVEKLVWGARDLRHGACGSFIDVLSKPHPTHTLTIQSGILENDSAALMKEFFRARRDSQTP